MMNRNFYLVINFRFVRPSFIFPTVPLLEIMYIIIITCNKRRARILEYITHASIQIYNIQSYYLAHVCGGFIYVL